ncbi:hypothetical protein [Paraburkholderia susongensis]|uniref:Uncharacterized protein n=1 Tax=Paraburkholderia susongensis TaxID=1515439 RepID=A0A1X7JJG2_9BURK|nr:hypothetical protein [Paraburkholderia susongensis]SMG28280.1 hypothetical protein SAMN06265784_102744 [Paraburkholderia susongensis]
MSDSQYLTPADFLAWKKVNDAMLLDDDERNQRAVDDAVIKFVMREIRRGAEFEDAGDFAARIRQASYGVHDHVRYTPSAVRRALRAIGWKPKRERAGEVPE